MIEVRSLTKIYRSRRKQTVALDHISFRLPERGMVFVVGKSGCGKSTLLNLIGGGDVFTSGEIVIDGNPMSGFASRDYDGYRNGTVGLIFQDYCLLEGLTVRENVTLALQLAGREDDGLVSSALQEVDLADKTESYPNELSGGQKQRAAIARALVKDAKYILADEPTGNLDATSARQILLLLKEISKTRLVLIVSHCRPDADAYADRIIELSDGHIIGDFTRDKEAKEIDFGEEEIVFQRGHDFTDGEIAEVNRRIAGGGRIRQTDTRFRPTGEIGTDSEKKPFTRSHLSGKGALTLFRLFTKKRALSMVLTSLCIVFMFVVLGVCQFFTQFDANAETARIMKENNGTVLAMRKGYISEDDPTRTADTTRLLRVTEEEAEAFRSAGYEGNIFPLYAASMITHTGSGAVWEMQGLRPPPDSKNYAQFFCHTGLGVLQVTEDYLTRQFGKNGTLGVLSGEIRQEGIGLIVTDYFADSILVYNPSYRLTEEEIASRGENYDKYEKLIRKTFFSRYIIDAVIETGYEERYAPLMEAWENGKSLTEADQDLAIKFYEELNEGLNLAYTVNPGFLTEFGTASFRNFIYLPQWTAEIGGKLSSFDTKYLYRDSSLKEGEITVRGDVYCAVTGESSAKDAVGKTIKIRVSDLHSDEPFLEKEFTIKAIKNASEPNCDFYISAKDFSEMLPFYTYAYALYFDNVESVMDVYEDGAEMGYTVQSPMITAMRTVAQAADVFIDLFGVIIWMMYALIALTIAGFATGSVKKCFYEIGVVRALGAKSHDLLYLFVLQMVLVSFAVCLVAGFGLWLGADVCNAVLAGGFAAVTKNAAMRGIHFIGYSWRAMLFDSVAVFLLTALCAVAPMLVLRRIKPREIIRAKE